MERDAEAGAEGLQVGGVALVVDVVHANMERLEGEVGDMNLGTPGEKLQQAERILATRQTDEDFIVLVDEFVLAQRLVECLPKSFLERHLLIHEYQIDRTDDKEESQDMVPMQVGALEQDVCNDAEYP